MRRNILLLIPMAAAFVACDKSTLQKGEPIIIKAAVNIPTKSNPIGDPEAQKRFNPGDRIELTDNSSRLTAVYAMENDGSWAPEGNKYLTWDNGRASFQAFYPAGYRLLSDQSDDAGLAASDHMGTALTDLTDDGSHEVSLEFSRSNSLVTFKISGYNNQFTENEHYISDFKIFLPKDNDSDKPLEITPYMRDNEGTYQPAGSKGNVGFTYTAIGYPESSSFDHSSHKFAELTVKTADGRISTSLSVMGIPHLEAGKSYIYNLVVGKDKVDVAGVTVNDWGPNIGISSDGFEAQPYGNTL